MSTRGTRGQTGGSARSRPMSGQETGDVPGRNQELTFNLQFTYKQLSYEIP